MTMFHGYELLGEWKIAQCSFTVKARKAGKTFFLKKYTDYVKPLDRKAVSAKTMAKNLELFEKFYNTRTGIIKAIRVKVAPGANIVIPCEYFIEGNNYVESTDFIDGVIPDEDFYDVLATLNEDEKKLLMLTAAGSLDIIHGLGIIHSDLKPKNLLLIKKANGKYVAKLIDFDNSYFVNDYPEEIRGTIEYYSPELGEYTDKEDDRDILEKKITSKSDIFSLGLIFHEYLCGKMPEPINLTPQLKALQDGSDVALYSWVVLNGGGELQISPKITSPNYISLIRDMLSKDPNERPTANEVLKRLKAPEPTIEEPWPEHNIVLNEEKLTSDRILGLVKIEESDQRKYKMILPDGRKQLLTKDELTDKGYATQTGFEEPWPEHQIEFDLDKIKSRGYVSGKQANLSGTKGYYFYKPNQKEPEFKRPEVLVAIGYAKKIASIEAKAEVEPGFDTPWPEHGIEFDEAGIKKREYVKIERDIFKETKGYKLTKADGSSSFMLADMLVVLNMAKRK